ncbi:MAG: DUF4837 family protein [Prevotella sp.]|nr:DUF4837 family protein [Prevotella sp.]
MKKLHASFSLALSILLMLCGCSDRPGLMPPSGGRLFEVLVVGDDSSIVRDVLQQDVPGLPQSEPQFDVSAVAADNFKSTLRLSRCIVMVHVDSKIFTEPAIRTEKNVWAEPQTVVRISAPSAARLRDSVTVFAPRLLLALNKTEMSKSLSMIRHKRNTKAERLIQEKFGITMWIPADMIASRQAPDFFWLSNNSPTTMKNIVVYRDWNRFRAANGKLNYYDNPVSHLTAARDYWLGRNIKGETDAMHMATVGESVTVAPFKKRPDVLWLYRGLWEMTGDDMGGPFVSLAIPLKEHRTKGDYDCGNTVVEGFVFAPGTKKRNAMRELEALLYTIKEKNTSIKN